MPEILTESFCERCGTRYTFESAAPTKAKRIGRFKTLSKGLKNYVLSDDTSMDEAMAAARSDEERELTSQQLDAFHSTFNFCMTCRQYTCGNCWNQAEGRCLTCAPHLGHEIMPAPFPDLSPMMPAETMSVGATAWPTSDLMPDGTAAPDLDELLAVRRLDRITDADNGAPRAAEQAEPAAAEAAPTAEIAAAPEPSLAQPWPVEIEDAVAAAETAVAVPEPAAADFEPAAEPATAPAAWVVEEVAAVRADPEPLPAAEAPPAVEPVAPVAADEEQPPDLDARAEAAARRTSALLAKFRPGQNIDAELEAYEASVGPVADEEPAVPVVAAEAEPVAAAPEPPAFAVTPEPEPSVAEVEPKVFAEPELESEIAAAAAELEPDVFAEPELEPEMAAAAEVPVAPEPAPPAAPEPEPVRADVVPQPTWRIVAPEGAAPLTNGHPVPVEPVLPDVAATAAPPAHVADPQWPAAPQWPATQPNPAILASRRTSASAATEALWAASARDVIANPAGAPAGGVQPCSSCGLSLSATARFCRRCGSRQGA